MLMGTDKEKQTMERCGKCENCQRVESVKRLAGRALAHADVIRRRKNPGYTVGEDVRLVWNRALEENPCTAPIGDGITGPEA